MPLPRTGPGVSGRTGSGVSSHVPLSLLEVPHLSVFGSESRFETES